MWPSLMNYQCPDHGGDGYSDFYKIINTKFWAVTLTKSSRYYNCE